MAGGRRGKPRESGARVCYVGGLATPIRKGDQRAPALPTTWTGSIKTPRIDSLSDYGVSVIHCQNWISKPDRIVEDFW